MNIQQTNLRKQTALVVMSTLTRGGSAGSGVRIATGTLAGNGGTILSDVSVLNSGNGPSYLAPGVPALSGGTNMTPAYENGPGKLTIGAEGNPFNLSFSGTGTPPCVGCNFWAEIGGTTPGTEYDQVVVNGTATIGNATNTRGNLTVSLINGYAPTPASYDTSFEILKATTLSNFGTDNNYFTTVTLPDSLTWAVRYTATSVFADFLGDGDHNGDNVVDAADYVLWRMAPTAYGGAGGYSAWQRNFGNTYSGTGLGGSQGVPEPAAMLLVLLGLTGMTAIRIRRQ
jgi:hypothetical protein